MKKLGLILFLALFIAAIPFVSAKSYILDQAKVDIKVNDDASLSVSEIITFNFNGPFTFAYRDIQFQDQTIEDIKVYDISSGNPIELKYEESMLSSNEKRIKWYYSANNEVKQFQITYTLKNALKVYDDVAEFNWKIWGAGWDHSLSEITGTFELPKKAANNMDVYTWGHPNLNGKIAIQNNQTVIFQAFGVPSYQWVELRVVFPSSLLKDKTFGKAIPGQGLQSIIDEENNFKEQSSKGFSGSMIPLFFLPWIFFFIMFPLIFIGKIFPRVGKYISMVVSIVTAIIVFSVAAFMIFILFPNSFFIYSLLFFLPVVIICLIFLVTYLLVGREPKVDYEGVYEREMPYDYSPALVSALINQHDKKPEAKDLVAVILNLCTKGYLKLKVIEKKKFLGIFGPSVDYEFIFKGKDESALAEHEKMVLKMIKDYTEEEERTFQGLVSKIGSSSIDFRSDFKEWQDQVKKEAIEKEFFSKNNAYTYFNVLSIIFLIIGFVAIFISHEILMIGMIFAGFAGLMMNNIFKQALPRRTPEGALHYKKWKALKHFLNDFSMMRKNPPESVELWEKYLVYAVTLDCADRVEKAMKITIPNSAVRSSIFTGVVNYRSFNTSDFMSSVNGFSAAFGSASGTSGSGGFGGGGGGGGGAG